MFTVILKQVGQDIVQELLNQENIVKTKGGKKMSGSVNPKPPLKYKLAEWKVLIPMSTFLFSGIFLIANFLGNVIVEVVKTT